MAARYSGGYARGSVHLRPREYTVDPLAVVETDAEWAERLPARRARLELAGYTVRLLGTRLFVVDGSPFGRELCRADQIERLLTGVEDVPGLCDAF